MIDCTALIAMPVTTRPEAEAWIEALMAAGLDYHFDDGAVDCLHGNGLVTYDDAVAINLHVQACYIAWEQSGADLYHDCPIGHCLKVLARQSRHGRGRLGVLLHTPTYATEFPDYPASDLPPIPEGFTDRSWRNEPCPCFIHEATGLVLWCDYADRDKREWGDAPRFSLNRCTNRHPEAGWQFDGALIDLCETDEWDIMARSIPNFINPTEGE